MQYVESNGVLLPGRVPGYKRDDIKLLPSNCTKRAVWMLYQVSTSLSLYSVAYTTVCKVWRHFLADVVVCKPKTDLCAICQKNSAAILRSWNKSEVCARMHVCMLRASLRKQMVVHPRQLIFFKNAFGEFCCVALPFLALYVSILSTALTGLLLFHICCSHPYPDPHISSL